MADHLSDDTGKCDAPRDWHVDRYDACVAVISREKAFTVEHASYPGAEEIRGRRGVQLIHGPAHRKIHAFLTKYFSSRAKELRLKVIRPLVQQQIDRIAARERIEVMNDFAQPLSLRVIAATLGLPHDDDELTARIAAWRDSLTPWVQTQGQSIDERSHAERCSRRLRKLIMPSIKERRIALHDDLITALWRIGPSVFPDWSENDVLDQCRIMLLAGSEGVARLTATVIHLLVRDPCLRLRAMKQGARSYAALVEHALRVHSPAQLRPRIATQPVTLGSMEIRSGDRICLDVAAANVDVDRFPETPDPLASGAIRKRHLSFNLGSRYCSGAPLARAEAAEAAEAFMRRLPHCRADTDAPPPQLQGFLFRGFTPLHVLTR